MQAIQPQPELTALQLFCPSPSLYSLPCGPVTLPHPIRAFAPGFNFALLVDSFYRLHSWGFNSEFQRLGRPLPAQHTQLHPAPVPIDGAPPIVDCASGANHSIVLTHRGRVYSFGADDFGQLGRFTSDPRPAPVPIPARIARVYCGWNFCAALAEDGRSLFTWGCGKDGQLGHGYFPQRAYPTRVPLQGLALCVALGHSHIVVLLQTTPDTRRVLTWGSDGLASIRHDLPRSVPRLPQADVTIVSAGKHFSIFLTQQGLVFAAGHGDEGQLGVEDTQGRNNACVIPSLLGHHIVNIAASHSFAIALSSEGSFFVWGSGILKPRKLRDGTLCFPSSAPYSFVVQMKAFASTAMLAAPISFPPNAALRPFRAFLKSFCEGQQLDALRTTRVYYCCSCPQRTSAPCNQCCVRAYGPLLSTASSLIKSRLQTQNHLDWSMYDHDCVSRSVKLLCSGVVDEDVSLETLQEMSALLRRYQSNAFERIIADVLGSRLLRRATAGIDYWDAYDGTPERLDERRVRAMFGRIQHSDSVVQTQLQFSDDSALEFGVDPLLFSVQSPAFAEFLQVHFNEAANSVPNMWQIGVWGNMICSEAKSLLEGWFGGSDLSIPGDEDHGVAIPMYTDVIRVAACLKMSVLMLSAEQQLMGHVNPSMTLNNWWMALIVSNRTGCKHAYHKLLFVADSVCARIMLRRATLRVEALEKSLSATDLVFNRAETERRALQTFRRSRIYCDGLMSVYDVARNLEDACKMNGYLIGEGNVGLDGRVWRTAEDEARLRQQAAEARSEGRRRLSRCSIA